jgi:hypothetical protein
MVVNAALMAHDGDAPALVMAHARQSVRNNDVEQSTNRCAEYGRPALSSDGRIRAAEPRVFGPGFRRGFVRSGFANSRQVRVSGSDNGLLRGVTAGRTVATRQRAGFRRMQPPRRAPLVAGLLEPMRSRAVLAGRRRRYAQIDSLCSS